MIKPDDQLFATVASVISKAGPYTDGQQPGVGAADPRILWTSAPKVANGGVVPVIDSDTGFLFAGRLFVDKREGSKDTAMSVIAALDPRIEIRADLGNDT